MKKRTLTLLLAGLSVLFLSTGIPASAEQPEQEVGTASEETWEDVIGFDSAEQVNEKFSAYFCSAQNNRRADKLEFSWAVEDGILKRTNNVDSRKDTVNISILTYTANTYEDFELSVDFRTGTKTAYWPVVGIRQQIPGKYYLTPGGGAGLFLQQNGKVTLWGPIVFGYLVEKDIGKAQSYFPAQWHNLRVRVEGTAVSVWVDGSLELSLSVASTDYVKGYVSLQSVNNDCAFDNFKIRALNTGKTVANEENRYEGAGEGTPLDDLIG